MDSVLRFQFDRSDHHCDTVPCHRPEEGEEEEMTEAFQQHLWELRYEEDEDSDPCNYCGYDPCGCDDIYERYRDDE